MQEMDVWISDLRDLLLLDEGVRSDSIARALQRPGWIDVRDIELIRKITQADPLYLTKWEIEEIISANISDVDALALAHNCERRCAKDR